MMTRDKKRVINLFYILVHLCCYWSNTHTSATISRSQHIIIVWYFLFIVWFKLFAAFSYTKPSINLRTLMLVFGEGFCRSG
ncbi:hypothetical protein QVD17_20383 [Tagetes erecta]|uniref:Uncharacterized protein n=1 Tax=Tagetes erecta TaxID=13708 RepID=A0AAD8NQY7_TARER|nr:hypothetical protein QVD17_20383 [Tagetes erecta]